jgi:hypothetical protein
MHEENPPPLAPNNDDFLWGVVIFTKETMQNNFLMLHFLLFNFWKFQVLN